jgi:hypothetical protein
VERDNFFVTSVIVDKVVIGVDGLVLNKPRDNKPIRAHVNVLHTVYCFEFEVIYRTELRSIVFSDFRVHPAYSIIEVNPDLGSHERSSHHKYQNKRRQENFFGLQPLPAFNNNTTNAMLISIPQMPSD